MTRFLHTADWQIGMKAAHVGAQGERVRSERLEAAKRVVAAAREHGAEFLVVAGDTFEDNGVDRVLVQKVADTLASFLGPVFLLPGNHDPLCPGSVWHHAAWSAHANLHLLRTYDPIDVPGAVIYPCPLFEKHSRKDPTREVDARSQESIAIGIAHGTVEGVEQDELDYPIARDAAERSGLDYLALGHWHSFATFASGATPPRLAYSGTHETTKFGERDSGNAVLVEIERRGAAPRLTPVRTGGLRWEIVQRELRDLAELNEVRAAIESFRDAERMLVDVRLSGVLPPDGEPVLRRIDELLRARFLFGRLDAAGLSPQPQDDRWLADLPVGVFRDVAQRLQSLAVPAVLADRPDYATPEVATEALLELYRLIRETKS